MSRALFWIALAVLIWFAVRAKLRAAARKHQMHVPPQGPEAMPPAAIENMTSCAHCGLHFPVSEAVHADGRDYCSPGHVRLPPGQP
ncbi:PP0621 family protein [Massilia sp. CMS3.1]|uniref:PP0621 family protein n=1 Tax=Massilia sp. CMS3.1 TaxID=3373083 RepID=UPI003EE5A71D